jgi:hypothetical protein
MKLKKQETFFQHGDSVASHPSVLGARSVSWSVFTHDGDCSTSTPLAVPSRGSDNGMWTRLSTSTLAVVDVLHRLRVWRLAALHRHLSQLLQVIVAALRRLYICRLAALHRRLSWLLHMVVDALHRLRLRHLATLHQHLPWLVHVFVTALHRLFMRLSRAITLALPWLKLQPIQLCLSVRVRLSNSDAYFWDSSPTGSVGSATDFSCTKRPHSSHSGTSSWILDTGAYFHMTRDSSALSSVRPIDPLVFCSYR